MTRTVSVVAQQWQHATWDDFELSIFGQISKAHWCAEINHFLLVLQLAVVMIQRWLALRTGLLNHGTHWRHGVDRDSLSLSCK